MNNIPKGYKQTEVGVIPEDWEARKLGKVSLLQRGFDLPYRDRHAGTVPIVSSSGVCDTHDQYQVSAPGVVTGRYGTIGEVFFIEENFWPLNTTLFVTDFRGNDPLFISYLLRTIDFKSHSGKSGVPGVNRNDLHELLVALPPKVEQTAIAAALSDADALIQSLEKLIAKKRNIKQGAMRELLKHKEGWVVKKLGEVVDFLDGKRRPIKDSDRAKMQGIYPYYGASGIIDYVNDYIFNDNLILLGEDGENILSRSVRLVFRVSGKIWVNNHAHVLKPKEDHDITFITELLESLDYEQYNTGTAQPKLNQKVCSQILIPLPSTKSEQTRIATILSDMDAEIAALETKLVKYKQVKQGMMQELLTGKTRLV